MKRKSRLKQPDQTICCLQEIHFKCNYIHSLKVQKWEKYAMETLIKESRNSCINII